MLIRTQAVYVIEIFYYFALFFIKMSLLFLYLRLCECHQINALEFC
jgi:hypothetical protein